MDYNAAYGIGDGYDNETLYFYDDEAEGVIAIPTRDRSGAIRIRLEELPHVGDLIDMLINEQAKFSYWVRLSIFYYKMERFDDFVKLLDKAKTLIINENRSEQEKDKVRALDTLAAYYVYRGNQERSQEVRRELFEQATLLYATADKFSRYDQNHLIGRAYFCLLEGRKEQEAEVQLDFVLKNLADNNLDERLRIPACMGKACIAYMRKDYRTSLEFFKKCLYASPNCPAFIRLGIGYCLVKLGKTGKAKIAFERCIELDPDNIDAQVALAVLRMNNPQSDDEMRSGIVTLGELYRKEDEHPLILNHLANHFFIKSEIDVNANKIALLTKVKKLLDRAIQITKNEQSLAESNFHMARYYHSQNQIGEAHRHYYQSCQFSNPKFVLPFYGYGQTLILTKDIEKAIVSFEKVLKIQPNNVDTLKVLGALYARLSVSDSAEKKQAAERKEKAKSYLSKAAELSSEDLDIALDLAVLLQRSDFNESLMAYNRVFDHLKSQMRDIPPELHNNIGVLHYRLKRYEKARECFLKCREMLVNTDPTDERTKAEIIVVSFNLARTDERLGKFREAEQIYTGILAKRNNYSDAILRLACMAYSRGDTEIATSYCKQLNDIDPNNLDAWILHGNIFYDQYQLTHAQKKYEQVLKIEKTGVNDPIALVAMGNIWLKSLFNERRIREKDQIYRDRALNFYMKALRVNPYNVYAAHGAGCILAQRGETTSACDIFGQVRENVSEYEDVWLNIANAQLDLGHYAQAAQLYQSFLHRFTPVDRPSIYMNIAFALYRSGNMNGSLDFIAEALREECDNQLVRYNHAVVSMKFASQRLSNEHSQFEDVQQAVDMLKMAEEEFMAISKISNDEAQKYRYLSRTLCGDLSQQCSDLLRQSEDFLARAKRIRTEELRNRELLEVHRLQVLNEKRLADRIKAEEEEIRLEKLKLRRRFFVFHNKDALKVHEVKDEPKQKASGGGGRKRKKQERRDDSDGFVNDLSDENDKVRRKKNKALARKKDRDFINDSDDDKPIRSTKRQSRINEEEPGKFKGKVKSRAFVDDSSSSSSDDEAITKSKSSPSLSDNKMDDQRQAMAPANKHSDSSDSNSDAGTSSRVKKNRTRASSSSDDYEKLSEDSNESGGGTRRKPPIKKKLMKKKVLLTSSESPSENNEDSDNNGGSNEEKHSVKQAEEKSPSKEEKPNPFDSDSDSDSNSNSD